LNELDRLRQKVDEFFEQLLDHCIYFYYKYTRYLFFLYSLPMDFDRRIRPATEPGRRFGIQVVISESDRPCSMISVAWQLPLIAHFSILLFRL
jgi:hypothetical protein